jgi:M3 family oligoendopeptidase
MKFSEFTYVRPDIDAVKKEMSQLIKEFNDSQSVDRQIELVGKINEIRKGFITAGTIAQIRNTLNTADPFYEQENEFFNGKGQEYDQVESQFYQSLLETPFRGELEDILGKQLFSVAESKVKTFSAEVMDLLTEESRLSTEYQKLIATAKIPFDGVDRSLAQLEKFLSDPNREIRKRAAEVKYEFFASKGNVLDELYDKLVKVRDNVAKKLGFNNFIELAYLRWNRTGWNAESAATFRNHILKHIVPLASELVEKQKLRVGLDKIKIYDEKFQFPSGNPTPKGDPDWIVEQGRKLYSELSQETKEFYEEMTKRDLFDLVNKEGKANVGYCTFIWEQRAPFIFANFNGTSNDIRVLVHEVGHAFQVYLTLKEQDIPEYFFPTMEAAEIFSMSMEFFVFPWAELFFKEDSEKHKIAHLHDSLVKIPRLCALDEFQHEVYANPDLTPTDRKQLWNRIEKKYMPNRDNDGLPYLEEGGYWQEIPHVFEVPFYIIDYALAQVSALEFWRMSTENWEKAWVTYIQLSRLGGSKSFTELLEEADLKSPFEEQTLLDLKNFLEQVIDSKQTIN